MPVIARITGTDANVSVCANLQRERDVDPRGGRPWADVCGHRRISSGGATRPKSSPREVSVALADAAGYAMARGERNHAIGKPTGQGVWLAVDEKIL